MKTLITHINPHLDDITAIWLFRRFHPKFKDAQIDFVSASSVQDGVENTDDVIYLGVGRGEFDEHKGDLNDCATSLVWKFLVNKGYVPTDEVEKTAIEELVEWARLIDLGKMPLQQYDDFSIQAFIRPGDDSKESSEKATLLGEEILDRVLQVLINKHRSLFDWEKRQEFSTKLGNFIVIESEYVNRAFCKSQSGDVFLMVNPKDRSVQYYADKCDLEEIYNAVKELDPEADWFLHQSHHMVICGSGSAPDSKKTRLTTEQLTEAVKGL